MLDRAHMVPALTGNDIASMSGDDLSGQAAGARARSANGAYRWVMSAVVFLIPITTLRLGSRSLDAGVVLAVFLAPVLLPAALASRRAAALMRLLAASALAGVILAELSTGAQPPNRTYEFGLVALVLAAAVAVAAFAAARRVLSLRRMAALYAAGALVDGLINPSLWQGNPWKYALGWPIAVLALTVVWQRGRLVKLATLVVLGGVGVVYSDRSFLGCCAVSAVLLLLSDVRRDRLRLPRSTLSRAFSIAAVVGVSFGVYEVGTTLALNGTLGSATQARTEQKANLGTTLIFAGRPEGAAALALAEQQPMGFGPGVTPSSSELSQAKAALASLGVDPNSSYVDQYMFGGHVELHSILGDMWADFGIVGLLTGCYLMIGIVRGAMPAASSGNPLLTFLAIAALWDGAFSPLPATLMKAVLAYAVLTDDSVRAVAKSSVRRIGAVTTVESDARPIPLD